MLDPSLASAALDRALLRHRAGRHDAAIADFRKALDAGANPAVVHLDLALALMARGELAEAGENLRTALRLDPSLAGGKELDGRLDPKSAPAKVAPPRAEPGTRGRVVASLRPPAR